MPTERYILYTSDQKDRNRKRNRYRTTLYDILTRYIYIETKLGRFPSTIKSYTSFQKGRNGK